MNIKLEKVLSISEDCLHSRARLKGLMRDLYPQEKREINTLLDVFESGIPSRIAKQGSISSAEYVLFLRRIVDEYAMQEYYAMEALDAWIDVFLGAGAAETVRNSKKNINGDVKNNCNASARNNNASPSTSPKPVNHSGQKSHNEMPFQPECDEHIFEYSRIVGGYAITKFVGFDEETISLPDTYKGEPVIKVANSAFKDCITLKSVFLGKYITVLETSAFSGCSELEAIYGCERLKYLGDRVFVDCRKLSSINISDEMRYMGKQALANTAIETFVIPSKIDYISVQLFELCRNLKTVVIHDKVIALGKGCFMKCSELDEVTVPASVKYIASEAFLNCTGLRTLTIQSIDAEFVGNNIIKESYTWQPDRRYNPRIKYKNLDNITVLCRPGSTAQMYCRKQDIACEKLEWNGTSDAQGTIDDPIGIWVNMSWVEDMKKKKYRAIEELEKKENVVVEHRSSRETIIFFYDPKKITKQNMDSLLVESFESAHTGWNVHVMKKREMIGKVSNLFARYI